MDNFALYEDKIRRYPCEEAVALPALSRTLVDDPDPVADTNISESALGNPDVGALVLCSTSENVQHRHEPRNRNVYSTVPSHQDLVLAFSTLRGINGCHGRLQPRCKLLSCSATTDGHGHSFSLATCCPSVWCCSGHTQLRGITSLLQALARRSPSQ